MEQTWGGLFMNRFLSKKEKVELEQENKELVEEANYLKSILGSTEVLNSVLINELNEIKSNYGDARKTDITNVIVKADEKAISFDEIFNSKAEKQQKEKVDKNHNLT